MNDNVEDCYALPNVCRSVKDATHGSFLESGCTAQHEVNNYCNDNYDPDSEKIGEFRDSAKRVEEFERTL